MSSDREIQVRRREALLKILMGDERLSEQKEMVERLHAMGIPATQSSVSRDLKALGAVRTQGYYEIPSWEDEEGEDGASPFRRAAPFVRKVAQAGPYQLFLATAPGAGRMVSQAINDSAWEDVVGTIDGDSSVLILTENSFFQRLLYERLKHYLTADGKREIVEME